MSSFRGFTVSFNSIGAGKILRKYLILATRQLLTPLLNKANINMVEAKCQCQIIINTRAVFRKSSIGTWIKYQLMQVVAPSNAKHLQAKRLLESLLPGSSVLEEYRDTAKSRIQCNEFVPDNKKLVFNFHRNGIMHYKYGEIDDLYSPSAPLIDKTTQRKIVPPWRITKREHQGIALPSRNYPLQRRLDIISLLDMLLLGVEHSGRNEEKRNNRENRNNAEMSSPHTREDAPPLFPGRSKLFRQSPPPGFAFM